jgi:hypothetical protein
MLVSDDRKRTMMIQTLNASWAFFYLLNFLPHWVFLVWFGLWHTLERKLRSPQNFLIILRPRWGWIPLKMTCNNFFVGIAFLGTWEDGLSFLICN